MIHVKDMEIKAELFFHCGVELINHCGKKHTTIIVWFMDYCSYFQTLYAYKQKRL